MTEPIHRQIRLLVVDDHPLIRVGVAAIASAEPDITVVAEAGDGHEATLLYERLQPDVVLMDLQMPGMGGIEAIGRILRRDPDARIVVLTTYRGDVQALRALKAGARGYLLKNAIRKDLVGAVREVHAGRRFVGNDTAAELAAHVTAEALSQREMDVLAGLVAGGANRHVADRLGVTEDTVKTHVKNIFAKLGTTDRLQAVLVAQRRGILDPRA